MKLLRVLVIAVFILSLGFWAYSTVFVQMNTDTEPPVLTAEGGIPTVSIHDGEDVLLQGLTARDNKDGDLTGSIRLVSVSRLTSDNTATADYAVFDSTGNVATLERTIRYSDYTAPRFALAEPLLFRTDEDLTLERVTASDVLDGDLSTSVALAVDGITYGKAGTYDISVTVFNSRGDSAAVPLKVVLNNSFASHPPVTLKTYLVYLQAGSVFTAEDYLDNVRSGYSVTTVHSVNTSVPGSYLVEYRGTAANGSTFSAWLTVVVPDTEVAG